MAALESVTAVLRGTTQGVVQAGASGVQAGIALIKMPLLAALNAIPIIPGVIASIGQSIKDQRDENTKETKNVKKAVDDQTSILERDIALSEEVVDQLRLLNDKFDHMIKLTKGDFAEQSYQNFASEEQEIEQLTIPGEGVQDPSSGRTPGIPERFHNMIRNMIGANIFATLLSSMVPIILTVIAGTAVFAAITGISHEDVVEGIRTFGYVLEGLEPIVDLTVAAFETLQEALGSVSRFINEQVGVDIPEGLATAGAAIATFFAARGILRGGRGFWGRAGLAGLAIGFVDYAQQEIAAYFEAEEDSLTEQIISFGSDVIMGAAAGAMIAGPWGALVGAIGAGLWNIVDYVIDHSDEVTEMITRAWTSIQAVVEGAFVWMGIVINQVWETARVAIEETWQGIVDTIEGTFEWTERQLGIGISAEEALESRRGTENVFQGEFGTFHESFQSPPPAALTSTETQLVEPVLERIPRVGDQATTRVYDETLGTEVERIVDVVGVIPWGADGQPSIIQYVYDHDFDDSTPPHTGARLLSDVNLLPPSPQQVPRFIRVIEVTPAPGGNGTNGGGVVIAPNNSSTTIINQGGNGGGNLQSTGRPWYETTSP